MKIDIIGAGMAGLLAANMLRQSDVEIHEIQPSLPRNHHAVLRFRDDEVSRRTGVPFRRVLVHKDIHGWTRENQLRQAMRYSRKTTGHYAPRSINFEPGVVDRWIAPRDFVGRISQKANIKYRSQRLAEHIMESRGELYGDICISTIPMYRLAHLILNCNPDEGMGDLCESVIRETEGERNRVAGVTARMPIRDADVFCSMYFPSPEWPFYRASIEGSTLIVEFACLDSSPGGALADLERRVNLVDEVQQAGIFIGVHPEDMDMSCITYHESETQKILPIDEDLRKEFITRVTQDYNVYSLGRFAVWKPGLLLGDLVQDIDTIYRLIQNDEYTRIIQHVKSRNTT